MTKIMELSKAFKNLLYILKNVTKKKVNTRREIEDNQRSKMNF